MRFAAATAGGALGGCALALRIWRPEALALPIVVHIAIGWSFVVAGLVAWTMRPENRTGRLMALAGIVWFGRDVDWTNAWLLRHLSGLSLNVFLALVAHLVLVLPHGRARSRNERIVIAAIYTLAIPGYALSETNDIVHTILSAAGIAIALAVVFMVVDRWLRASPPARRALEPALWAGPPVLAVAGATIARDYLDVSLSARADTALDWLALVYVSLPAAFLLSALRTRLRRAALGQLVVNLGSAASPHDVREALAWSLGDPSLQLALARGSGFVGTDGRALQLPSGTARTDLDGHGVLVYDGSLLEDPELVTAAAAAACLALDRARDRSRAPGKAEGALAELSPRELEVLALVAEGRTDRGIAQALYVTPKTVEAHVRSIFRKLGLPAQPTENRRVHAVLTFLRARS